MSTKQQDFLVALRVTGDPTTIDLQCYICQKVTLVRARIMLDTGAILLECTNHPENHPFFRASVDVRSLESLLHKLNGVLTPPASKGNS